MDRQQIVNITPLPDRDNLVEDSSFNSVNEAPHEVIYSNGYKVIEYKHKHIYVIENIIEDELCSNIINIINTVNLQETVYSNGNNVECFTTILDDLLEIDDTLYYKFSNEDILFNTLLTEIKSKKIPYTNKLNGITRVQLKNVMKQITSIFEILKEIFDKINKNITFDNTKYILRKIYGPTRKHIDGLNEVYCNNINFIKNNHVGDYKMIRNSSIIFALNDNYDGGLFFFPEQDISFKLKKGSVLIFPPYWTHPHEVSALKNNTYRYTLNTWSVQKI